MKRKKERASFFRSFALFALATKQEANIFLNNIFLFEGQKEKEEKRSFCQLKIHFGPTEEKRWKKKKERFEREKGKK